MLQHISTSLLIECRAIARQNKNWLNADLIRNELDNRLCFVFDTKEVQEIHSFSESYFSNMGKISSIYGIQFQSKRDFVEWKIKDEIRINKLVDAWIYSTQKSIQKPNES
jgi:hypothetical protein